MYEPRDYHRDEVSQTEKDKYDITCMQNLKNSMEEFI